jgi:hypothetical protein
MPSTNSLFLPKRLGDAYFGTGTYKMMLVTAVPSEANIDAWDFRNDVTGEVTGSGYTAGGFTMSSVVVSAVDTTNNRVSVTFTPPSPALAAATISGVVGGWIYKDTGSAATDELIQFVEFGSTLAATGGPVTVTFSAPLYINR